MAVISFILFSTFFIQWIYCECKLDKIEKEENAKKQARRHINIDIK